MALTAFPVVTFNSGTGSDTAASGAGPGTAVTGTAAAHTNGASSTTITFTNSPDLSGVAQDGSHVLWLKTASGRQFSRISTVDNGAKTCVVENSFNIASGSAVDYAIGAKRSTWENADSRTLFGSSGASEGWSIVTETDQTVASELVVAAQGGNTNGLLKIIGDNYSTRRKVTTSANSAAVRVTGGYISFSNLTFGCSNGTKTTSIGLHHNGSQLVYAYNCVMCDPSNTVNHGAQIDAGNPLHAYDCDFSGAVSTGVRTASNFSSLIAFSCRFKGNGTYGVEVGQIGTFTLVDCLITGNGSDGVKSVGQYHNVYMTRCTVHGNTGDGLDLSGDQTQGFYFVLGNNFTGNGNYGIRGHASTDRFTNKIDFNNYGSGATANTSGDVTSITKGSNDLNVDPGYANAAGDDYAVGTNVKALGFPYSTRNLGANQSSTKSYVDIGAAQRQEPAGGGTPTLMGQACL